MNNKDFDHWVSSYISYQKDPNCNNEGHPQFWAVELFLDLGDPDLDPALHWKAILEILRRDFNDEVTGILAAGPLEDLIHYYGEEYIDIIEVEAQRNPAFKKLLHGVWESSTPEIWQRIIKARE